jgi:hypothetical protein
VIEYQLWWHSSPEYRIINTGTNIVLLPTDAFEVYQIVIGGVLDPNIGLLTMTKEQSRPC